MKANFVIPSWSYWKEPLRAQPLTQLYLATILEEEGHRVVITDFREKDVRVENADAFFYTVASPDFKEVTGLVKKLKDTFGGKHIAGGPHPSIFPKETKKVFDAVAVGRGEESIKLIAEDVEHDSLHHFYYLPAEGYYPFPKRHFLPERKIVNDSLFKTDEVKSTTAQFSFGCPYGCSFCANYTQGKTKRNRLEKISAEIEYLKEKYGIEGLSLQDEIAIPENEEEALKYLGMMKSKGIKWRGQNRAKINRRILRRAKESGLVELSIGLESVNQEVLDKTHKGIRVKDAENTLFACKDYGIKTRIYLLNGLPGEPGYIVKETKDFIERTTPDLVLLSSLQPYPGSPLADNPEKYGMTILDKDFSKYNHLRGRFKDSKDNIEGAVPYEYKKGKGLPRQQIMDNLVNLQSFLRDKGLNK